MPEEILPWYNRTFRWGQTNLSEQDPSSYDVDWWVDYWRKTHIQGVIVNAGGIVAFYPSHLELHQQALFLGERDLFGEICAAARAEHLVVLARMDSNRASQRFFQSHPDWFAIDSDGKSATAGNRYIACINSPYTREYLPDVLREIIENYHPDGITDNSWTGSGKQWICHCHFCKGKFARESGLELPLLADWENPVYRRWVRWSYACRLEVWDLNNQVSQSSGGADCLWLGMIHGNPFDSHLSFCDLKAVSDRAHMLMSDQQSRGKDGFEQNAQSGKLLHDLLGWDKTIAESMAHYVRGAQAFRKASAPALETQKWMVSGFSGGISPWWHHVGAFQEDRRQFETSLALMEWHTANEDALYRRIPIAVAGLVWSHENTDFFGREQVEHRVAAPWRGMTRALLHARVLYLPVHADYIERDVRIFGLRLLILPNLAVLTQGQVKMVRRFVEGGGSLIASSHTSLCDEDGHTQAEFELADLFGVHWLGDTAGSTGDSSDWEVSTGHNYLRLSGQAGERHPLLEGFERTDILAFGGSLPRVKLGADSQVVATYIPDFPIYPPESSWMRQPVTDLPAVVVHEHASGGRVVYFAANIDACYGLRGLPDHGNLLANAIRWALKDRSPISISGPGLIDCTLYRQENRLILHLVNLNGCDGSDYLEENFPAGPLEITIASGNDLPPARAVCRVSGEELKLRAADGHSKFYLPRLVDHEMIVIEWKTE